MLVDFTNLVKHSRRKKCHGCNPALELAKIYNNKYLPLFTTDLVAHSL